MRWIRGVFRTAFIKTACSLSQSLGSETVFNTPEKFYPEPTGWNSKPEYIKKISKKNLQIRLLEQAGSVAEDLLSSIRTKSKVYFVLHWILLFWSRPWTNHTKQPDPCLPMLFLIPLLARHNVFHNYFFW